MESTWEHLARIMLVQAVRAGCDLEQSAALLLVSALKTMREHPEWVQAQLLAMPDNEIVNELVALLVSSAPIERMLV